MPETPPVNLQPVVGELVYSRVSLAHQYQYTIKLVYWIVAQLRNLLFDPAGSTGPAGSDPGLAGSLSVNKCDDLPVFPAGHIGLRVARDEA